ncbi:MAG: hypothetical protein R3Y59_05560 [bacterium]
MKCREIVEILSATPLESKDLLDFDVNYAFASDLMSDVLTVKSSDFVLITGLVNLQTLRTAEMSDIKCVVFVRGKEVSEEIRELAKENDILIMTTSFSMFHSVGLLYSAGLKPVF